MSRFAVHIHLTAARIRRCVHRGALIHVSRGMLNTRYRRSNLSDPRFVPIAPLLVYQARTDRLIQSYAHRRQSYLSVCENLRHK